MRHRFARNLTALAAVAVTGFATAGNAAAAEPDRFTVHVDDTFLSRTSEACGFDILLHLEGTIVFTDFVNGDGELTRSLTTYPGLFFTFINAETGTSVTSRSPDPEHYTWASDGSFTLTITGLVMRIAIPGSGEQSLYAGNVVVTVDANGDATEAEPVGRSDDYHAALCEVLAL